MELEDAVYSYPDLVDPGFQSIINAKKEFIDLASDPAEVPPQRDDHRTVLLRHQELIVRYMSQYDRLLLFHGLGTGKATSSAATSEFFLNNLPRTSLDFLESYFRNRHTQIKRTYVLVRGESLRVEYINQLVRVASDGKYLTHQVLTAETPRQEMAAMTSAISPQYRVMTYGAFINLVYGSIGVDEEDANEATITSNIANIADGSMIIVDEAHGLRIFTSGDGPEMELPEELGYDTENAPKPSEASPEAVKSKPRKKPRDPPEPRDGTVSASPGAGRRERETLYRRIHTIFQRMKRSKLILLSGTPMIGDVAELRGILNLVLPEERQIPASLDIETATVEDLEPYARGVVSFVRARTTSVRVIRMGEVMENVLLPPDAQSGELVLYPDTMSSFQAQVYLRTPSGVFERFRQEAADFVFPDGSFGGQGFRKYVKKISGDVFYATPELSRWLADPEKLRMMSTKYHTIGNLIKERPGLSFVYMSVKVHGSGAIVFGLSLEARGFSRFKQLTRDPSEVRPGLRYALITSATSGEEQISIQRIFASPENADGSLIKTILGTRVARDGLNLANVVDIHFASGDWTESSNSQAEGRGLRIGSHRELLRIKQEQLEELGEDPNQAEIDVSIFRHVAVVDPQDAQEYGGNPQSVDVLIYSAAEKRDISIKRVLRLLMRLAIDCTFHRRRNVIQGGRDYTSQCDYDVCDYACYPDERLPGVLFDSYDVLYAKTRIDQIARFLRRSLSFNFNITIDEISEAFGGIPRSYIEQAIARLVKDHVSFRDRFGRVQYLRETPDGVALTADVHRLTRDIGLVTTYELDTTIYSQTLIGVSRRTLGEILGTVDDRSLDDLINAINRVPKDQIPALIKDQGRPQIVEVVESLVLRGTAAGAPTLTEHETEVLKVFRNFVIRIRRHTQAIGDLRATFTPKRGQKGRRASPETLSRTPAANIPLVPDETGEYIHIHRLGTLFDRIKHPGDDPNSSTVVRILEHGPGGLTWRSGSIFEDAIYRRLLHDHLEEFIAENARPTFFGLVWPLSDEFPIVDRRLTEKSTGKVCESWHRADLLVILKTLGVEAPDVIEPSEEEMRQTLAINRGATASTGPVDRMPLALVRYLYAWIVKKLNVRNLCSIVGEELRNRDLIVQI